MNNVLAVLKNYIEFKNIPTEDDIENIEKDIQKYDKTYYFWDGLFSISLYLSFLFGILFLIHSLVSNIQSNSMSNSGIVFLYLGIFLIILFAILSMGSSEFLDKIILKKYDKETISKNRDVLCSYEEVLKIISLVKDRELLSMNFNSNTSFTVVVADNNGTVHEKSFILSGNNLKIFKNINLTTAEFDFNTLTLLIPCDKKKIIQTK